MQMAESAAPCHVGALPGWMASAASSDAERLSFNVQIPLGKIMQQAGLSKALEGSVRRQSSDVCDHSSGRQVVVS